MTPKQIALSRLSQLALNSVSDSPPNDRADVCRYVATALKDECPDLAALASKAAHHFHEATETESNLLKQLEL